MSTAENLLKEVVKQSVTSVLKPLGFRKTALNFHRRHQALVQVVNLQGSQGSSWDQKLFYVNVGLAFDDICKLTDAEILEKPKEYECDQRGFRARLENLVSGVPDCWTIRADDDLQAVGQPLRIAMEQLATELEAIDSVHAYREHRWFDCFQPSQQNAQVLYLLGDLDGAWHEVQRLCELFADRQNIKQPRWWIESLGLVKLAPRCN